MAINQDQTLKEFNEAQKLADKRAGKLAEETVSANELPFELKKKISEGVDPKLRAAQRVLEKQFYSAPASYRSAFGDVENPLVREKLAQQAAGNIQDQLSSIRDLRATREGDILDIVSEFSAGLQANLQSQQVLLTAAQDKRDTAWNQYKEAVRQFESARRESRLSSQQSSKNAAQTAVLGALGELSSLAAKDPQEQNNVDTNEFIKKRNEIIAEHGEDGRKLFDSMVPLDLNNLEDPQNISLLNNAGLNETLEDKSTQQKELAKTAIAAEIESRKVNNEEIDWDSIITRIYNNNPLLRNFASDIEGDLEAYYNTFAAGDDDIPSTDEL